MSVADELQKLQELRDSGTIDDDEFATAKTRVLNGDRDVFSSLFPSQSVPLTGELLEKRTRQWATLLHLSMLANLAVPGAGLICPIIIWQVKKEELPALDAHGRNATNFIISSLIYTVISGILVLVLIGVPMLIAVILCSLIFPIMAAVKANNGETWKYPFTIEFV